MTSDHPHQDFMMYNLSNVYLALCDQPGTWNRHPLREQRSGSSLCSGSSAGHKCQLRMMIVRFLFCRHSLSQIFSMSSSAGGRRKRRRGTKLRRRVDILCKKILSLDFLLWPPLTVTWQLRPLSVHQAGNPSPIDHQPVSSESFCDCRGKAMVAFKHPECTFFILSVLFFSSGVYCSMSAYWRFNGSHQTLLSHISRAKMVSWLQSCTFGVSSGSTDSSYFIKHRKNCECCPVSQLFLRYFKSSLSGPASAGQMPARQDNTM